MSLKPFPLNFLLIGEFPPIAGPREDLVTALVCRAVNKIPGVGSIGWLERNHPGLHQFVIQTTQVNLFQRYPGTFPVKGDVEKAFWGQGQKFSIALRNPRTDILTGRTSYWFSGRTFVKPDLIIFLGHRVAKAFGLESPPYLLAYIPIKINKALSVVVPHPNGTYPWWNEKKNPEELCRFLGEISTPGGFEKFGRDGIMEKKTPITSLKKPGDPVEKAVIVSNSSISDGRTKSVVRCTCGALSTFWNWAWSGNGKAKCSGCRRCIRWGSLEVIGSLVDRVGG